MAMSRKHYREVAELINHEWTSASNLADTEAVEVRAALTRIIFGMSDMFGRDNSNFSHLQFTEACVKPATE